MVGIDCVGSDKANADSHIVTSLDAVDADDHRVGVISAEMFVASRFLEPGELWLDGRECCAKLYCTVGSGLGVLEGGGKMVADWQAFRCGRFLFSFLGC